ncbi:MAG: LptF/LptG family permease [Myxococcota bacterium]|nr:LptF/LptG family permease [Myxococcota bacterium]
MKAIAGDEHREGGGGTRSPLPLRRRPGATLYRYVGREALVPAAFGLFGLTAVVLTASLLELSDLVINRGVGAGVVARLLFYEGVPVASRMLPFAVLVGALVAIGRLGADREVLALEASGVAASRLVGPVVAFAGAATGVALLLSAFATPWASLRFDETLADVARNKPWASLRAGAVSEFGDWQLEARQVSAAGDELDGVLLWVPDLSETVFARTGQLATTGDGSVEITLEDGSLVLEPNGRTAQLLFQEATTLLPEGGTGLERRERDRIPNLPLGELVARARAQAESAHEALPRAALELHRRFAYPVATLVFGVLAAPLCLVRGKLSRATGGVMGLLATLSYYGLMQLGEGLVQARVAGPALGAWFPNLLMGALAGLLLLHARRQGVLGSSFERSPRRRRAREAVGLGGRRLRRFALPRYVAGRALQLLGLSFAILFVAYFLIDLMDRLSWFSKYDASAGEILRFYGARVWLLASRATPMAMLVGASLTVSLLAAEGELIGMRACGIPAPRALLPVLLIAAIVAPLYFLLNNVVVPQTNALADELKETEIKDEYYAARREQRKAGYRSRSGGQVLEAALFDPDLGQARGITIFDLGDDGLPTSRTDAVTGRHIGHGWWRLTTPTRVEVEPGRLLRVPAPRHAQLGDTVQAEVDTMHLSAREIAHEVAAVEADGFDATPFRVDFHVRLAEPFACLVLPALVLLFAVGGPPFPTPAQTLLVSAVVGVSYVLLVAVSSSLGRGGVVPPIVSAWAPIASFALLTTAMACRLARRL